MEPGVGTTKYGYGFYANLQALLLADLEKTPFIDLQNGQCSFDNDTFCELLELCKKYAKLVSSTEYVGERLSSGKTLMYMGDVSNIQSFSQTMTLAGEDYNKSRQRTHDTPVRRDIYRDYIVDIGEDGYVGLNVGESRYRNLMI